MRRTPMRTLAVLPAALLMALVPGSASAYPNPGAVSGDIVVHDPSMIRGSSGEYLLYSTGEGLQLRTSTDRTAFGRSGNAFTTEAKPGGRSTPRSPTPGPRTSRTRAGST